MSFLPPRLVYFPISPEISYTTPILPISLKKSKARPFYTDFEHCIMENLKWIAPDNEWISNEAHKTSEGSQDANLLLGSVPLTRLNSEKSSDCNDINNKERKHFKQVKKTDVDGKLQVC